MQGRIRARKFYDNQKSRKTRASKDEIVQRAENRAIAATERNIQKEVVPVKKDVNIIKAEAKTTVNRVDQITRKINNLEKSGSVEKPLSIKATDAQILEFIPNRRVFRDNHFLEKIKPGTARLDKTNFERFQEAWPEAKDRFYDFLKDNWDLVYENSEVLSTSNRKNYVRILVSLLSNMEGADPSLVKKAGISFNETAARTKEDDREKTTSKDYSVPVLSDFVERFRRLFPDQDKLPRLILELATMNPFRDNYKDMILVYDEKDAKNPGSNYMYVNIDKKEAFPVLRNQKTSNRYDVLEGRPIRGSLYNSLLTYIREKRIQEGQTLFPSTLNKTLKQALQDLGIKQQGAEFAVNNFFRHLIISNFLKQKPNEKARVELAQRMGHSEEQQRRYLRLVDPQYFYPKTKFRRDLINTKISRGFIPDTSNIGKGSVLFFGKK